MIVNLPCTSELELILVFLLVNEGFRVSHSKGKTIAIELPPEVETTLIEADTGNEPNEQREEAEDDATIDGVKDDEDDEPLGSAQETQWVTATTRAGLASRLPARYRQEINAAALNSQAWRNYYELLIE